MATMVADAPYSFAEYAKEECAALQRGSEASLSLLSSYFRLRGKSEEGAVVFYSEHAQIARALYERIKEAFGERARFAYLRGKGYLSRLLYKVILDDPDGRYLSRLSLREGDIDPSLVAGEKKEAAYLAGAFLASGSVSSPSSSNYHLEISVPREEAPALLKALQKAGPRFPFKSTKRGHKDVLYLKKSSSISDFLVYVGAQESCLRFENARVDREFAAISNRFSNLDGANYRRSYEAGEKQLKAIERASRNPIYLSNNPKLAVLIALRKENPDASMSELAKLLGEKTGTTVSKSNVNHLFRKLLEDFGGNEDA